MKTLVVIPARGGSTRIPQKNLQSVGGLSLLGRAIRTAGSSSLVERIAVSTDDGPIETAAAAEGAEVVRRPTAMSGDQSPVEECLLHVLETLRRQGSVPEVLVLAYCTAPFATVEDLDGAVRSLESHAADSAFAAVAFPGVLWSVDAAGHVSLDEQRQSSGTGGRFIEAGSFYAMRTGGFLEAKARIFGRTAVHAIDAGRHLVIETPADLYRARRLAGDGPITLEHHRTIYVDVDETICVTPADRDYRKAVPIAENIARINARFDRGHEIVYWTARGGRSGVDYTQLTGSQLDRWQARYHRLQAGKPSYDLLICDKATSHVPQITLT